MTPAEGSSSPLAPLDRLQAYLEDRLSNEDVRHLEAELRADPRLCAELVRLARDEGIVMEWARSARAASDWNRPATSAPTVRKLPAYFRSAAIAATLLAATLFLTLVLNREVPQPPERFPQPLAHLEQVQGEVLVVSPSGATSAAKSGQDIYPGEQLRTGDSSYVVVQYNSSARFEVGAETVIHLPASVSGEGSVRLEEGLLTADFVGQPDSNPMYVQTPHAEARASGSRVSFSSAAGGTLVDPEEGTIEVTRTSDGVSIHVPTGSYAIASERAPFLPRPLPAKFGTPRDTFREGSGPVQLCATSSDGKLLASGGWDGTIKFWEMTTGEVQSAFRATNRAIRALAWSHEARWIALATDEKDRDRLVRIWDARTARETASLKVPVKTKVAALSFSPDDTLLATGGGLGGRGVGEVRLWDTRTWTELANLSGHDREVLSIAFSPDGTTLATGAADGEVRLWDVASRTVRHTLPAHKQNARVLVFSPDGSTLVSGGRDALVRLWDARTGAELRTLHDHTGEVRGLAFSADGRVLATSGADRMVRLYDGDGGRERISFRGDKHNVCWVGFSLDGRTLITAGWDKTIKLWDLGEDELPEPPPPIKARI